jgi:hypothetical protein
MISTVLNELLHNVCNYECLRLVGAPLTNFVNHVKNETPLICPKEVTAL